MLKKVTYSSYIKDHGCALIGTEECALSRSNALEALDLAQEAEFAVLGGDVYLRQSGKISPAYANWSVDKQDHEKQVDYIARSCKETREYILEYPNPPEGEFLFVLVVS